MSQTPYEKFINANLQEDRPLSFTMDLTTACNLACTHCLRVLDGRFIPFDMATNIIDEAIDLGVLKVGFNGGEPTYHPDFQKIVLHALESGLMVNVNTNGTIHHDILLNIAKEWAGLFVKVSLYGWDDASGYRVTGVPFVFSKTFKFIQRFKEISDNYKVSIMVRKDTADNIPALVERLKKHGIGKIEFIYRLERREDGDSQPLKYSPSLEQIQNVMKLEIGDVFSYAPELHLKNKNDYSCGAGVIGFDVSVSGKISPCMMLPVTLGYWKQKGDLKKVWYSKARQNFLNSNILRVPEVCKFCGVAASCAYCTGSVYRTLARYGEPHPISCLEAHIRDKTRNNFRLNLKIK